MMSNTKRSAREIFNACRQAKTPHEQAAIINLNCGEDELLRERVIKLLLAREQTADNLLQQAVNEHSRERGVTDPEDALLCNFDITGFILNGISAPSSDTMDISDHPMVGPYKLLEEIGHGGMGMVYMAQQVEPVRRKVALKIIKPGMDSRHILARFEAERQALALMDHPNIAKVLDGGTTESRRPYFVMELVHGTPITTFSAEINLSTRQRLELFIDVCRAIQHAHLKGVIHRDLKPSNVLVTMNDDKPLAKVIDFGVAKALSSTLTEKTLFTAYGQMIGTPLYMSPEQAQYNAKDVDVRSDIFSLGVVLYELLTGTTPFDKKTLKESGLDEMRRLIREVDPPSPSIRVCTLKTEQVSRLSGKRQIDSRKFSQSLKGELDWIVMKALEKDRERRYESANALAADIQRYLRDEPVEACPPSMTYRLKKYARKHKGLIGTAVLLIVMLVASTTVSGVFAYWANEARIASQKSEQNSRDAQAEAETEKENAVAARQQSEENFSAALAAIDKLLEHASSPELRQIPQSQPIRQNMMEDVLKFYESAAPSIGMSQQLRHRAARTWMELGNLMKDLGKTQGALQASVNSMEQINSLIKDYPDNASYRHTRMDCAIAKGYAHHWLGTREYEASQREFERVRKEIKELRQARKQGRFSDITERSLILKEFHSLTAAGFVACVERREDDHASFVRQAYAIAEKHALEGVNRATIENRMAQVTISENPVAAEKHFKRSIAEWILINDKQPTRHNRSQLAGALGDASRCLQSRDRALAYQYAVQAAELSERNYSDFPSVDFYGTHMWRMVMLMLLLNDQATEPEALQEFDRFNKHLSRIPTVRHHYKSRIATQFRMGNYSQVLTDMRNAAIARPEWRDSIGWISISEIEKCPDKEFREGVLSLAEDVVDAAPELTELRVHRAELQLAMGHSDKALEDFKIIAGQDVSQYYPAYKTALIALSQNEVQLYQEVCEKMLDASFSSLENANAHKTHFTSWTCALAPHAIDDYEQVIKLARHAVEKDPGSKQYLYGLGAVLLRAGKYDEAKVQLEKALEAAEKASTSHSYTQYFLAMTEHYLGHQESAQKHLKSANKSAETELAASPVWNRKLTLVLLRKEAESLIH